MILLSSVRNKNRIFEGFANLTKPLIFKSGSFGFLLFFLLFSTFGKLKAQSDSLSYPFQNIYPLDLKMVIKGKEKSKNDSGIPTEDKLMWFAVPILGSNPTLGAFYGLGGTGSIYLGNPKTTNISSANVTFQYTSNNQFISSIKGIVLTPNNSWELLLDLRYSIFSENTYGLGSDYNQPIQEDWNIGGIGITGIDGAQPLESNQVRVHFTALKAITKRIFVGAGYHLDYHYNIDDLSLDLNAPEPVITSHYTYSTIFGFDPSNYLSSGLSADFMIDDRDHTVNAYEGNFIHLSYRFHPKFLGSETDYQMIHSEARVFKPLSKTNPRHLLALWGIGQFTFSGDAPYSHLPSSGNDMRNRIGRGYVGGRFRGNSWITAEAEYRFPISESGLLSGVVFGNATTTSRDELTVVSEVIEMLQLFEAIRPAGGAGLRILLERAGRLNLGMDFAIGQNGSKGFYFVVGETF